jgi:hypothetical protein
MSDEQRTSPGGSKIYQYNDKDFKETYDDLGSSSLDHISEHIAINLGEPSWVLHELVSPTIHVDIHVVEPTEGRNFITLITSGMSDKPMIKAPLSDFRFAELVIALPVHWEINEASVFDENYYWPIRALKYLARFPHELNTWLWAEHTISNGNPPQPFADSTRMDCMLLSSPILFDKRFLKLKITDYKTIHFLSLIPLYPEEARFKLERGIDALYTLFEENGVSELLDPQRPSCC